MLAFAAWCDYSLMKSIGQGTVVQIQSSVYVKHVQESRHYIKTIAEVNLLTASQNIGQRGHRENKDAVESNENVGNFLGILRLISITFIQCSLLEGLVDNWGALA